MFVGLDLSPGRIKVVGVTSGDSGPRVVCAADDVIPAGDATRFDVAAVASQLAATLARLRVRPASIALALGPGEAVARRLSVVDQERAQMLAGLSLQLGQVLGSEVTAPRVGFVRLSAAAAQGRVAVFAGAARPDAVAAQQRAVASAGYAQGPVTTAAGGLLTAWRACRPDASTERRAVLLHVGDTAALWVILDGDEPASLDAPLVGLASIRERAGTRGHGGGDPRSLPAPVVAEWAARLRQEIARGLQAARRDGGRAEDGEPYEIWVSGGGSRVAGFLDALAGAADVPVHAFDPIAGMEWAGDAAEVFGPALVPALGAALQAQAEAEGAGDSSGFDLRVAQESRATGAGRLPPSALARTIAADRAFQALALVAALMIGGAAFLDARLDGRGRELAERESRVAADSVGVAASMERSQTLDARRRSIGGQVDAMRALEQGRHVLPELLAGIPEAVPASAWVSDIVSVGENPATGSVEFRIHGFAASDAVAGSFAQALVRSRASTDARVERTSLVKIGRMPVVKFELTGTAGSVDTAGVQEGGRR